jgi:hypothetical protein
MMTTINSISVKPRLSGFNFDNMNSVPPPNKLKIEN